MAKNYQCYTRYFREQHAKLEQFLTTEYDAEVLQQALNICKEAETYSANSLEEAYAYAKGVEEESYSDILPTLLTGIQAIKADVRNPKVAKRKLSYYSSLVNILGRQL